MTKKNNIPNPSQLTKEEYSFINNEINIVSKSQFKGRMISMSDTFYKELNDFLKKNPTEGNRSSFIVRVLSDYMKNY